MPDKTASMRSHSPRYQCPAPPMPPSVTTLADQRRRRRSPAGTSTFLPDGAGLPPGRGDVKQGEAIFAAQCASCHGAHGEGKPMDAAGRRHWNPTRQEAGKDCRQFLALCDDIVRLCAPRHAAQRAAIAHARRSLCRFGLCAVPQRDCRAGHDSRRRHSCQIKMPNRDGFVSAFPTPSASAKP